MRTAARRLPASPRVRGRGGRSMALAKMHVITPDDDAGEPQADEFQPNQPQARPEELRLLEAMLFAATEPLAEKDLAARLPEGLDVRTSLKLLQQDYAARGVNLI